MPYVHRIVSSNVMNASSNSFSRLQLVHDYWAANIWALYLFASKIASFVARKSFVPADISSIVESYALVPFPEPPPSIVALCLLLGLTPALIYAWKAACSLNGADVSTFFIHAVVSSTRLGIRL